LRITRRRLQNTSEVMLMDSSQSSQSSQQNTPLKAPPPGTPAVIEITEKAAAQIKLVQERENRLGTVLRVSVMGGGCSGLSYKLSFEDQPKEKDKVFEAFGVKLVVDGKSLLFLKGTMLDFTDGLTGQGFVFTNPNAKQTCGCGSSFSA